MSSDLLHRTGLDVDDGERSDRLVDVLTTCFKPLMDADPGAFRLKFRKMAADPFAFYRGSACVFYEDVSCREDRWVGDRGARTWIHGDLHVENFGTYLDSAGRLVFDVNDFDEAYLGHWTWDLQRFVASLALLCWRKALPDAVIDDLVEHYVRSYVDQVLHYTAVRDDTDWALTLQTAEGAVLDALHEAKLASRLALLDSLTVVDGYRRRFANRAHVSRLDDAEHAAVCAAFERYLDTIPADKRSDEVVHDVLDVVGTGGFGIGSAGLPAYNVLIEGFSQALDNDVVLSLKQGNVAAPSRVVDLDAERHFHHHGHRTALSQRALQAHADRFLGWTDLDTDSGRTGFVVSELSPYQVGLDWEGVSERDEFSPLVEQLGRATAKMHCVSDSDSDTGIVDFQVEQVVAEGIGEDVDALVEELVGFAHGYAARARVDHRLFVDAFRAGAFEEVGPLESS